MVRMQPDVRAAVDQHIADLRSAMQELRRHNQHAARTGDPATIQPLLDQIQETLSSLTFEFEMCCDLGIAADGSDRVWRYPSRQLETAIKTTERACQTAMSQFRNTPDTAKRLDMLRSVGLLVNHTLQAWQQDLRDLDVLNPTQD
jgi:hypothetical protein